MGALKGSLGATMLCLSALACGGSEPTKTRSVLPDADAPDLSLDAGRSVLDASVAADATSADSDSGAIAAASECAGDVLTVHAARTDGRAFTLVISANRIYVAYLVPTCGGSLGNNHAQGIAMVSMATSGAPDAPVMLANAASADCDVTRIPTLAALKQNKLSLFFASNRGTGAAQQVFLQNALDGSDATELSSTSTDLPEELTVRIDNSQAVQLIQARGGQISVLRTGAAEQALTPELSDYEIAQLAVTNVGTASTDTLGAMAWISSSLAAPGIFLRFYGVAGPPTELVTLAQVRGGSSVAMATQDKRGAVVYSDQVGGLFLRTLELDKTLGAETRLTSGNQKVSDVSIARFGIGYVVAYRSVALAGDQSVVRVLVIDELGVQAGTRFIAEARRDGQGLDVRVANDGRLILTWADPTAVLNPDTGASELETTLKVARLTCL